MDRTINILNNDGVILHLTDTTWGLAASCLSEKAIDKIYNIKQRPPHKSLLLLVSSITMLKKYVEISDIVIPFISDKRPTTIIYNNTSNIPVYLLADDGSIAIRVVQKKELSKLIDLLGHPLVSTSANLSGTKAPLYYEDIDSTIINKVDLALPELVEKIIPPSKIIHFKDGEIKIIRD